MTWTPPVDADARVLAGADMTPAAAALAFASTPHERLSDSRATLRQVAGLLDEFGGAGRLSIADGAADGSLADEALRTSLMHARSEVLEALDSVRRTRSRLDHAHDYRRRPANPAYAAAILVDVEDRLSRLLEGFDLRRFGLEFSGELLRDESPTGPSR